jgi:Putative auto-transporter adhesin, head GIN domain
MEKISMKKITVVSLMLFFLMAISGCKIGKTVIGSGVRKTEKRDLPVFKSISMEGAIDIQATCQKPATLEIEGDDNIIPLILTDVRDGVLHIKGESGYSSAKGIIVRVTVPELESVEATGAGKIRILDLKNDAFKIHSTGASEVSASGTSKNVEIQGTGAGGIDAHNLRAEKANVSSVGASKIQVYATEQLDATASGAGEVRYSGDPKVVNKHANGAATVSKREQSVD